MSAARMKAAKEHRVPLCAAALELLRTMEQEVGQEGLIFPGRGGGSLSNATMDAVFDRLGVRATPHGLRSSFRDWAGDCTQFPREVAEAALAHRTGDAVELAYRRGDALAERREMMDAWDCYCCSRNVVMPAGDAASRGQLTAQALWLGAAGLNRLTLIFSA